MGLLTIAGYELREQLYNGYRSLVYRGIREVDSLPVVIKLLKNPYPSFSELVKFRNQYTIAKNLKHPGIIQTYSLETYRNGYTLVMEDFGGISLKDYFINNNHVGCLDEFLEIATDLSNTLDYLMGHGVIHKDIKPANIVINPETKQVKLIDFSIASLLPRETQTLISPNILEGTLGYISPEQTGRINRGIDYRTDFYSLGVTFYELLTQELPFQSEDAMELVYSHIAKMPMALKNREEIPQVLSDIVMKLMAKDASARYQSALGLKYDLEKCLVQIQETGKIEDFAIAQKDVCARFTIPDKLYGREAEVETVLQGFERVNTGATEMMLVTGFSGIGKTAVVNEVHKPIVRQRGYLIKGKFDQFQRNIPFTAFVQAFRDLMGQLLTESDFHIQQWKNRILDAVGQNGQVIIEVIPELERIIGQQPPTPQLSGIAAQNRFNLLFQKFVQIFTTAEHPLVIFLDDLQWADSASLKLIELLMSESAQGYLLLIGAYRDNEVSAAHPLMLSLAKITKSQATVNTITLNPLSNDSLNQLIADTLSCATEIAQPLTQLVYQKTSGNPFFSRQFLKALYEDGLIKFDYEQGNWQCNTTEVKALALTDNVVEFMALQLQKLPEDTQSVLRLAACVGNQFDLATLAIISQQSEIETAAALWQALHSGLILPTSEIYKFYIEQSIQDVKPNSQIVNYKFLHDRIQQAAYSLIPPDETAAVHLSIGRLLQKHTNIDERELQLFKIVNQLNRGRSLINDATEREELAHLNKRAGAKARTSSAYDAAMNYLNTGLELLSPQCWQNQYDLSLELHQLAAEVTYLCGHHDQLTKLLAIGLQQSHHLLDRAKFYEIEILALMAQHQARAAVDYACKILPNFGIHMPQKPSQLQIILGFFATLYHMSSKTPRDLLKLPPMSDPYKLAAMSLLTVMGSAAATGMPEILPFTTFKAIPIYLRYGNIPKSSMAYMIYAFLLCEQIGRIDAGYAFGKAAIKLCHQTSSREALAPTLFLWNRFIAYRKESLHSLSPLLLEAYQISLEVGNLEYAAYTLCVYFAQTFFVTQNLVDLALEAITSRLAIQKLQQSVMVMLQDLFCQIMENLITAPDDVCQLVGRFFDETVVQDREVQVYTSLFKTLLAFWFNRYELAIEQAAIVEKLLGNLDGTFFKTLFYFYDALLSLAVYPDLTSSRQKVALAKKVKTTRQRLAVLAKSAPMNYHHQQLLLEAEYLRVLGKLSQAIDFYDRSISGAKENGYIQQEALANELAAKFYLDWGKQKVAQTYMQQAYYCYARWGALAKIRDLEKRYPQLLNTILQSASASSLKGTSTTIQATASNSSSNISSLLDLDTIVKVSQSFTSEIHLERLVEQVMQAVVSNAGADKGALILNNQNSLTVVSQYVNSQVLDFEIQPLDSCLELPISIVHYVARTLEFTIANAEIPDIFSRDPYFSNHSPQSLLCTPILKQGQLIAVLYLENNLTSFAFTRDRLEILNLLCTQAAISLENASLYNTLEHKVIERTCELSQALNDLKAAQKKLVESEKMAALGGLVAGIAHEINTPIGIGITVASTLAEETKIFKAAITEGQLKKSVLNSYLNTAQECSTIMLTNLQRAGELIQSFKQVAVDQTHLEQRQISLKSYIDDILTSLSPKLRQAGHSLTVTGDESIQIFTYPGAISQMLVNLLNNSLEHAYPTRNPGHLEIHISETHEDVTLVYSDDGCGIPRQALEKIFEPFFTTARSRGGNGLGLHIVYNLVTQKLGGGINVESQVGQGTVFTIKLPRSL